MGKLRFYIALWAAKLTQPLLKLTHHNGTNFPGKLAVRLCPNFLKYIKKPEHIITVTGTNGKTTVANMAIDILELSGKRVLHNRMGSNIITGISTGLLNGVSLFNKPKYDLAVLEVDERSSVRVYPHVKPDITVIVNLFRDSIMRNAHPQYMADFLTRYIPPETKLILNADDLISSAVSPNNERVYFGIEKMDTDLTECINRINDVRICPKCAGKLEYDYVRYHHIGRAHCTECGFESPAYDYAGSEIDLNNMTMTVRDAGGSHKYRLLSNGIHNIYNELTVIALMRELGMSHEEIAGYMEKTEIVATRYSEEAAGDVKVIMHMAKDKNALACSRAFDYISHEPGNKELFLMMNCLGDERNWSENTCWIYDCDFEFLNTEGISHIVAAGPRCRDYKLRMLLAGVPEEKISCERDEYKATELLKFAPDSHIYILYGTDSVELAFSVRDKVKKLAEEASK